MTETAAISQQEAIQKFIQGTVADSAPVIPVSAQLKYNVDVVCEYIMRKVPVPVRCVRVCMYMFMFMHCVMLVNKIGILDFGSCAIERLTL